MNYIINPMWFYWLQVVDATKGACLIVAVATGIVLAIIICFHFFFSVFESEYYVDECAKILKYIKLLTPIFIIATFCVALIPSKRTLIEMEVAKHATYSNVESVKEQIKDAADYILDRLEGK